MKLSFFNSLPDDIPLVLGQRVQDKPAQAPMLGDQTYNYMAPMLGDQTYNYMAGVAADIAQKGKRAVIAFRWKFPDLDQSHTMVELRRGEVLAALRAVKEKHGVTVAKETMRLHGGGAELFMKVDEEHLRPLMDACCFWTE